MTNKKKYLILAFVILTFLLFFYSCDRTHKDDSICKTLVARAFDTDSSLIIAIPSNWDSTAFGSFSAGDYEKRYYKKIASHDKKEKLVISRFRLASADTNSSRMMSGIENEMHTTYYYSDVNLKKVYDKHIGNIHIATLLYSLIMDSTFVYMSKSFFYNSDTIQTTISLNISNPDTSVALRKINCIINSIDLRKK